MKTVLLIFSSFLVIPSLSYKPVMLVPGFGPSSQYLATKLQLMLEHRGTDVVIATYAQGMYSMGGMWNQVHGAYNHKSVAEFIKRNPDGFHMLGGSQGSVTARALIEYYGLPVINFVSVSGVHMGITKFPKQMKSAAKLVGFDDTLKMLENGSNQFFYSEIAQNKFSGAGYVRDPCNYQKYLDHNKFLAVINNEVDHVNSSRFKENFCKIKQLYLFDSPDDGVVYPWQSGHFGSLTCNGTPIDMRDQKIYKDDSFGLQSLDLRGAVNHTSIPHVSHFKSASFPFFHRHILPLLT